MQEIFQKNSQLQDFCDFFAFWQQQTVLMGDDFELYGGKEIADDAHQNRHGAQNQAARSDLPHADGFQRPQCAPCENAITAAAKKERRRFGRIAGGFGSRRRMDRMFRMLITT